MSRWLVRLAVLLAVWLYLRSPVDLLPEWLGWPGVLDDLFVIALAVAWLRRSARARPSARSRARGPSSPRPREGGAAWDPYAVLGISRGASAEEVQRAYREQMRLYHPDRVAGLGAEIQEVAHRRTLEIRRAYDELRAGAAPGGRFR